jgi:hypothetical protein
LFSGLKPAASPNPYATVKNVEGRMGEAAKLSCVMTYDCTCDESSFCPRCRQNMHQDRKLSPEVGTSRALMTEALALIEKALELSAN